jgi:UDP-N-acetylglucosamine--N-acetylmuramyl-(pentapeptide) pyrophosphoryl-undecaprenol N-acetylglucosamine transferase
MTTPATILFAGGGTGGHIYPNLAVLERLREVSSGAGAHFVVSNRAIDQQVLDPHDVENTPLPMRPFTVNPLKVPALIGAWRESRRHMRALVKQTNPAALVATGGFVSVPAAQEARRAGVKVALVNLDAVPGKANRLMTRYADVVFTCYDTPALPGAERIGLPLRAASIGPDNVTAARTTLGLDPAKPTLMVTGGSQGAQSVNGMVVELLGRTSVHTALQGWQVLHISGPDNFDATRQAYDGLDADARLLSYCDRMGCAWRAATLAICRAGAGSVAEAWANAAPAIFFPYPGHRDQHQKLNAQPLIDAGGAMMFDDLTDAKQNADAVEDAVVSLAQNRDRLAAMAAALKETCPPAGAETVAQWLAEVIDHRRQRGC